MKNPVERFQWKRPADIRRFPKLLSDNWDSIVPLLLVIPGYNYPEMGFCKLEDDFLLWFEYGNPNPVEPTHWQQLPGLPKHP